MVYSSSPSARIPGYSMAGTPNQQVWGTPPVVQTTTTPELVQAKAEMPESKPLEAPPTMNAEIVPPPAMGPMAPGASGDALANPALAESTESFPRRSSPDHMATPDSGHAEDYSWLVGKLQYSRFNKSWRLRFASVDEEDRYGGSVTIVDDLRLAGLKDGQTVRVEGHLTNPEARTIAPPYEVNSIQALDKRE
jgi:hypothetical protein